MKRAKIIILSLIAGSLTFVSCDSYLSELPDNRTQLDSKEKIGELLVGAYPMAGSAAFLEVYSDNVFDSGEFSRATPTNTQNYNWEMDEEVSVDSPSRYWDACYEAIAAANQALEAIEKMDDGKGGYDALKGEALVARAYAHFELVLLWGKAYNPSTADTDLGVPYVDVAEKQLVKQYERNTVAEVYARIESDLEEGLKLVTSNYRSPKFHFNVNAAKAFAAKFYLTKGEWDKVLDYSAYLGSKPTDQIRDMKTFSELENFTQMADYTKSKHTTNLLMSTGNSYYFRDLSTGNPRFQLTGVGSNALFAPNKNPIANKSWILSPVSWTSQKFMFYPKYWEYFRLDNPTAGTGVGFLNYVLLSNDELYLNRMEALIMSDRMDEAMVELEYFLGTRTAGYNPSTDKLTWQRLEQIFPNAANEFSPFYSLSPRQATLLQAVLSTKQREFIHEGKRWFDIKRLNIVVTHKFSDGPDNVLEKDDLRRQIPLPLHVVATGLVDNPR